MNASRVRCVGVITAFVLLVTACSSGSDVAVPGASVDAPVATPASTIPVASDSVVSDAEMDGTVDSVSETTPSSQSEDAPDDGSAPKNVVTRSVDAVGDGVVPEGVSSVTARVTSADGEVCEVCLWLADDDAARQRGLMDVTDLGEAVGMAFRWDEPRTGNFFMFQTPTPLSIAWFDEAGAHVGQADMEPCLVENSAVCERYTADSPYVLAVEMFGGQLDAIGIGPGSMVVLLDLPCA